MKERAEREGVEYYETNMMMPVITVESTKDGEPLVVTKGESVLCFEKIYQMLDPPAQPLGMPQYRFWESGFGVPEYSSFLNSDIIDPTILNNAK